MNLAKTLTRDRRKFVEVSTADVARYASKLRQSMPKSRPSEETAPRNRRGKAKGGLLRGRGRCRWLQGRTKKGDRGGAARQQGPRGIASGAKIRFARCRLHPRASPPTYLRSAGSIRTPYSTVTPAAQPATLSLAPLAPLPVHHPRHPHAPRLESSNEHRPLILPTATLLDPPADRPNSIPHGPQTLELNHPSFLTPRPFPSRYLPPPFQPDRTFFLHG